MQDTEAQTENHILIARRFLEAADKLFDEGDFVQTSEKLWGATSQAVKVLCLARGWSHGEYAHIRDAVNRLAAETGDDFLAAEFKIAYGHHLNFYTDAMEAEDIDTDRPIVRELVDKLLAAAERDGG